MLAYWVYWCGHPCNGNPHATKEAAEKWIKDIESSARAAGQAFYGHYSIEKRTDRGHQSAPEVKE